MSEISLNKSERETVPYDKMFKGVRESQSEMGQSRDSWEDDVPLLGFYIEDFNVNSCLVR